jgi:DNA invertase Pin-like site-specific DNA recombinase
VVNRLAWLGRNTGHTIQLVEEFNHRGVHFRALDLGINSRTPAGKMIVQVFAFFNQYERENNREKSLVGIELAKQQGKPLACREADEGGQGLGEALVYGRDCHADRH